MPSNKIIMIYLPKTVKMSKGRFFHSIKIAKNYVVTSELPVRNNVRINSIIDDFNLEGSIIMVVSHLLNNNTMIP